MARLIMVGIGLLGYAALVAFEAPPVESPLPLAPRTPVLVELFTTQACSSCPPADELLIILDEQQPVPGALVIPLSEHVDYWNDLGWRDPYSAPQFTARQQAYRDALDTDVIYTPQMVVDGRFELVGSQRRLVEEAIRDAASSPRARLAVTAAVNGPRTNVRVEITVSGLARTGTRDDAELWVAVTEDGLVTDVTHGENVFRRLRHAAVVRRLDPVGLVDASAPGPVVRSSNVSLEPQWRVANLRVVAFVQERIGRRVLGVTQTGLG